jgi:hypothetical protein
VNTLVNAVANAQMNIVVKTCETYVRTLDTLSNTHILVNTVGGCAVGGPI